MAIHIDRGGFDNQIRTLTHIGVLHESLLYGPVLKLTNPQDAAADVNERARSWLHINCAHCHRFGAGGSVASFFTYDQTLEESRTINFSPSQGAFGIPGAHVITPGDPLRSVLYYRVSSLGPAHMPRIGSRMISEAGVNLIYDWIKGMPKSTATNGTDEVAVAHLAAEHVADRRQDLVSLGVTLCVVYALEVIEIDQQDGHR